MKLVVFGLTISSSWGNGHATLWRGLCRALADRGHQLVFFEKDVPYYAAHRDLREWQDGKLVLYQSWDENLPVAGHQLEDADAAMVTSYCPDGPAAAELVLASRTLSTEEIRTRVHELGEWFHNLNLRGVQTAPNHFLGNYPELKWRAFANSIPSDLTGKTVLDIGCNAGFYSIEMKRRGAERVVGVDFDDVYIEQAKFAAEISEVEIEFRKLSVYDISQLGEKFDVVLFLGVLYHLRHPLLALDIIRDQVARDLLIFQSMQRGSNELEPLEEDYHFWQTDIFEAPGYPRMFFVENKYSGDPTNWWIPNRACTEAMLRNSGFELLSHPEPEVYICRVRPLDTQIPYAVYPARKPN